MIVTYLVLIEYFSWESYKLLDCETIIIYSRRSVYFDEELANLMKSPEYVEWEEWELFFYWYAE